MSKHTPLHAAHLAAGAKMTDFSGYDMPLNYGSQVAEHEAVRKAAGVFDVSHMLAVDLAGPGARNCLRRLLSNDVDRLREDGQALYSAMLSETGGVLDDLLVYRIGARYRLVLNCGRRDADLAWIRRQAQGFAVEVRPRTDLAILALQGPEARRRFGELFPEAAPGLDALKPFRSLAWPDASGLLARTGYTGEDGLEIMLPAGDANGLWERLLRAGVSPVGLAARDTLRLEAGMNLYGNDMDETVSPIEANMRHALALADDRQFIGREAVAALQASGQARVFCGLLLEGRGVLRPGQRVYHGERQVGSLLSGAFSPTLRLGLGLCRLQPGTGTAGLSVAIRDEFKPVRAVRPPFVRHGKAVFRMFSDANEE